MARRRIPTFLGMNLNYVLKAHGQHLCAVLVHDFDVMGQSKVAVADLAAGKVADSCLGLLPGLANAGQFHALGIERDFIAVEVKEKAGHVTKNARSPATFKPWRRSSSPSLPLSRLKGAGPARRQLLQPRCRDRLANPSTPIASNFEAIVWPGNQCVKCRHEEDADQQA